MKKAFYYASAAAAIMSAGSAAFADEGWYGRLGVGAVVDGKSDIDAPNNIAGALDQEADVETGPLFLGGLGYSFASGMRLEGVVDYRNLDLDVLDTFEGPAINQPAGTVGPEGNGSVNANVHHVEYDQGL